MAKIRSFRAVRPTRDKAHLVASRSYVTYTQEALENKLSENPYSFIHIINPDFSSGKNTKAYSSERFEAVKKKYTEFLGEEIFITEPKESLYIYKQTTPYSSYIGIIGCADTDEYYGGKIKKHENTLAQREEMFKNYLDTTNFNAEPVLLAYKHQDSINDMLDRYSHTRPEYDFSTTDRVRHQLWVIDNVEHIQKIKKAFQEVDSLYIADGHHRCASSALLAKDREARTGNSNGAFKGIMSYFVSDEQLDILPFHRIVSFDTEEKQKSILAEIKEKFAKEDGEIRVCTESEYFRISLKNKPVNKVLEKLCSEQLTQQILTPICGIKDLRHDNNIHFLGGRMTKNEFRNRLSVFNNAIGFYLNPVDSEDLFSIADEGEVMPPKSTYIEPKLRSGLTIMEF